MTQSRPGRRSKLLLFALAVLTVLVPFLFWWGTWFGRTLTDEEIEKCLSPEAKPRKIQHALVQLSERISRGERVGSRKWSGAVERLAGHPVAEVRMTVAWFMGQDNQSQEFHQALTLLVQDPEPLVRQNAALSLVSFGDEEGRPELLMMLRPYTIRTAREGALSYRLKEDDSVNPGTLLARIQVSENDVAEVRSPLPGFLKSKLVEDGKKVSVGEAILLLAPAEEQVWEALRALYLVGQPQDLPDIEPFAARAPDMSDRIRQQALQTINAIKLRSSLTG